VGLREFLLDVYGRLYRHFGPRHWWPADTPFEVIVGAILTQQVSWGNVEKAINNLKERQYLSVAGILALSHEELGLLIRPTRYFNQKAQRLKDVCRVIREEFGDDVDAFLKEETGALRNRLLKVRGVGKETADSILLYAAGRPVFVIDSYTHRILQRLGRAHGRETYDELQCLFESHLPRDVTLFSEYHALLVALGHHTCLKSRPQCSGCPLAGVCVYQARLAAGATRAEASNDVPGAIAGRRSGRVPTG
jgi:endonuclease-3 related protein